MNDLTNELMNRQTFMLKIYFRLFYSPTSSQNCLPIMPKFSNCQQVLEKDFQVHLSNFALAYVCPWANITYLKKIPARIQLALETK
jgi:hypothetical protein